MRALVIDDDPQVVSIVCRWLRQAGYCVITCHDFLGAAFQIVPNSHEAVVVDVRLGAFNGLQLAIRAREYCPRARIVVMSAWDDPVLKRDAARCGAAYIVKPFNSSQLLTAIGHPLSADAPRTEPFSLDRAPIPPLALIA